MKLLHQNNNYYIVEYNNYIITNMTREKVRHELNLKEYVHESTKFMEGLVSAMRLMGQDKWDAYMMLLTDGAMEGESVMNQGFAHKKLKALLDDEAAWKRELGQGVVNVWMMTHDGL